MSIGNLTEQFLYDRLPAAIINGDEMGLIEAVVSGFQDRLEDLRAFAKNLDNFWAPGALPTPSNNVILVDLTSLYGKSYTRSLDIQTTTPPVGSNLLASWAADQLGLPVADVSNVRYGYDSLRAVDTNTLAWLAATLGALLYQTNMLPTAELTTAAQAQLVNTWFPRLKIKGTTQSFEVLGRILGFDDVRVTPLWTRLSPRVPSDAGAWLNTADFASIPEYFPRQNIGPFYDPFNYRDGPFFAWTGTASNGTNSTSFYTQTITGHNPWINVVLLGELAGTNIPAIANGTVTHPATGSYTLAGGAPYTKAQVDPPLSSVRFQAIAEGADFNGLSVHVASSGTLAFITVVDRLSAIKYRSSYFDLGLTAGMDKIEDIFGSRGVTTNQDLKANPSLTPDGMAVSPYRPWVSGSLAVAQTSMDWVTSDGAIAATVRARHEADPGAGDRQLNMDSLVAAGVQVTQAFEEVRVATRSPRRSQSGFLIDNDACYAPYTNGTNLFVTQAGQTVYGGFSAATPWGGYKADVSVILPSQGTVTVPSETNPLNQNQYLYSLTEPNTGYQLDGNWNFSTGIYQFTVTDFAGVTVVARWTLTDSGTIRPEPFSNVKATGTESGTNWQFSCLGRPEDEDNGLVYEVADDYPWRREVVVGGELVELDSYYAGTEIGIQRLEEATAFNDQTGVDIDVFGITSRSTPHPRVVWEPRATAPGAYQPAELAIGYQGELKNLSALTPAETALIRPPIGPSVGDTETDYDTLFQPGYKLYHVGLAQGVLVADLPKFFGAHHSQGLQGWLAFNEHIDDDLAVADHSFRHSLSELSGLTYQSRAWDDERGWYLRMAAARVASREYRDVGDEITVSFWIRLRQAPTTVTTIVLFSPIYFVLRPGGLVTAYADSPLGPVLVGSAFVGNGEWNFVYIRRNAVNATFGIGTLSLPAAENNVADAYSPGDPVAGGVLYAQAYAGAEYDIQDFRLWNVLKSEEEMDQVRYHAPVPTLCTYRLGFVYTLDREDKFGVRILPSGWACLDILPAWYRRTRQGLVLRYDSMGSYHGDLRFKEVGVGSGRRVPDVYTLGQQFVSLTAEGTAPFSTDHGQLPGWNPLWQATNYAGNFEVLPQAGATATGIVPVVTASGTVAPWPNTMAQSNPFRTQVYVNGSGTYSGTVFQVGLFSANGTVFLSATPLADAAMEIPSGAYVLMSDASIGSLAANPVVMRGTLVAYSGTNTTPPLYLYTSSRVAAQQSDAFQTWTDAGLTPIQQRVDISAMPSLATVTGLGTFLNTPCLGQAGVLEFNNTGTIFPGAYELTVVSGQIGQADVDFDGFNVDINVNDTLLSRRLLRGMGGYNFRGTNTYEFELADGAAGQWLLSFDWLNPLEDDAKGTKRQLAIYAYTLRQIITEMFRVRVKADVTPEIVELTDDYHAGTTPGGWYNTINSYGTSVGYAHESNLYRANDTVSSIYPLGDTLTALTNERRNDVIYIGSDVEVGDAGSFVFPSFGSTGTVSVYNPPLWMWAGAVTVDPSVTVVARMTGDTSAVRVAFSKTWDFSAPVIYSDYAEASVPTAYRAKMTVNGLEPWTKYYYAVENSGSLYVDFTGTVSTFGTGPMNFSFGLGACERNTLGVTVNNPLWAVLAAKDPLFMLHVGDLHYYDINTNDINRFRVAYDSVLSDSSHRLFWSQHAVDYVYDDHDYGPNDSDTTAPGKEASRLAYRESVPHYAMAAGNGNHAIYHTFTVGRCRFIVTDNRSERTPYTIADNDNKTVLGAEQKKWFKQQLLEANADPNIAVAFWCNSFPFTGTAKPQANPSVEHWAAYPTERAELATFIKDNDVKKVFILSGDMHACAFDDGRTYDFSTDGTNPIITVSEGYVGHGLPVFQAAPLSQTTSSKGTPYEIGPMIVSGAKQQFGMVSVYDDGVNVLINFAGYDGNTGLLITQAGTAMNMTLNGTASPR